MRALVSFAVAAAALGFASAASADPVEFAPVAFSEHFQEELTEDFGEREGPILAEYIERQVSRALTRAGAQVGQGGGVTVEITLVDADVTKPTFEQMGRSLGLSYALSQSVGGAELIGVLRGPDGRVLAEVNHKRYAYSLDDSSLAGSWGDAFRSIRIFADKMARAYRGQLSSVDTSPT